MWGRDRVAGTTERLILRLAEDARPVRRLGPPALRALRWLGAIAAVSALAILATAHLAVFRHRLADPRLVLELAGTIATGVAAVIAAFYLSLPDRSAAWALLPLPPLALWIASSGYACWLRWIAADQGGWALGESMDCFAFILIASLPLGASLAWVLARVPLLTPIRVAAMGGLGVAALAAFILQFFHPFDVTFIDLGFHLAAVLAVTAACSALGGVALGRRI